MTLIIVIIKPIQYFSMPLHRLYNSAVSIESQQCFYAHENAGELMLRLVADNAGTAALALWPIVQLCLSMAVLWFNKSSNLALSADTGCLCAGGPCFKGSSPVLQECVV